MLKARHIEISYYQPVLLDACFEAHHGKLTGLIGESGSGKSSLLNRLSLYSYDHDFEYEIDGLNIKELSKQDCLQLLKSKIAYLRQECTFMDNMRIDGNLRMEAKIAGKTLSDERLHQVLKEVELDRKEKLYPAALSGGEKQRLAIALALVKGADILFLDEITSALDEVNTQKIIEILQHLAYEDRKLIVLATHDESLINVLDDVYEIQDEKLMKMKESRREVTSQVLEVPRHQLSINFYFQMAWARIWKKRMLYLLTLVGGAVAIAIFVFAEIRLYQTHEQYNRLYETLTTSEIMVNNNCFGDSTFANHFDDENLPLSTEFIDDIRHIDGVHSVYPYEPYFFMNTSITNQIEVKKDGQLVFDYEISDEDKFELELYRASNWWGVSPYYPEQGLEEIATFTTDTPNGIYIDEKFAENLGLEIENGQTMSFDVQIPVTYVDVNVMMYHYPDPSDAVQTVQITHHDAANYSMEKIRIELPISGLLPSSYQELAGTIPYFYIPYELRENYASLAMSMHVTGENEKVMSASAVKVFLEPDADREEVKSQISALSSQFVILDKYVNIQEAQVMALRVDSMFTYVIGAIAAILVTLLFVYSFYHARDVYKDSYYYNIHGLQLKERRMIALSELGMTWLMFFVISLIGLNYLIVNGMGDYVLNRQVPIAYIYFVLADVLVSGIVAVIVDGQLFRKKYL
ncbi:Macrolide export ATP-binding/permease protein MacB [Clostridiales bacterium CHKCI006]|nr:Macrolide export ATP-binding/permease protein MacB [Clostridiales bacterium CHKCI006]